MWTCIDADNNETLGKTIMAGTGNQERKGEYTFDVWFVTASHLHHI